MRVVIVDDEVLSRRGVTARLRGMTDVTVVGEFGDGPTALAGLETLQPDLVFLDIQMPGLSGLDVLARTPPAARPVAILLTAHANFALRAFELNAVDYLLKPIDDARFVEAVDRARQLVAFRFAPPSPGAPGYLNRFAVRAGKRVSFIAAAQVTWIEADADYAVLHAGSQTYLIREPLHRLAAQLDPAHFLRVHRCTIVRIDQVAEVQALTNRDAMLRLHDGTPLRASRTYVAPLRAALRSRS
jgi:two-component system, LytTR family, response regulator